MVATPDKKWMTKFLKSRPAAHGYFWLFILLMGIIEDPFSLGRLHEVIKYLVPAFLPVYAHFFILDTYLIRKRYLLYAAGILIIVASFGWLLFEVTRHNKEFSLFEAMMHILFYLLISMAIRFGVRGIRRDMIVHELESKQAQTELALLKSQINPHFLFNTLNNLYAMANLQKDSRTADGISRLAHLMRYVIYEANAEKIELSREIEQIRSYIELQKLRFPAEDESRIEFSISGKTDIMFIAPMLLIPFVENAFKHSASVQQPILIEINLQTVDSQLHFTVKNSINRRQQFLNEGNNIGLTNVKRRLELLYPERHSLNVSDQGEMFFIELKIETGKKPL
jgi:LytS/YehU family sensor histidine kinase